MKSPVPAGSLLNRFFPADYSDAYYCVTDNHVALNPDDMMCSFWTDSPGWVNALFKLRNFLVKFVGLKGDNKVFQELEDCIRTGGKCKIGSVPAKSENETVLLLEDKHLNAYMSVFIDEKENDASVYLNTLVHYKNRLGRVYFFFVRPFHGIVVKNILKRVVKKMTAICDL